MSPLRSRLLHIDAVEGMRALPSSSIPLTVTSPPYDRIRDYGGHLWDWEKFALIAHELRRVTMPGGVLAWVVRDQWRGGSLTCSSYRQVIFLTKLGFWLDSIIYARGKGFRRPETGRYPEQVTPCYILSRGTPRAFHPIRDRANSTAGRPLFYSRRSRGGGATSRAKPSVTAPIGLRTNVWEYAVGGRHTTRDGSARVHPALMPEALARDLILSWSRPGDVVLDPLGGAGTTAKMALLSDRRYVSMEVHRPYHEAAVERLALAHEVNLRRLEETLGIE